MMCRKVTELMNDHLEGRLESSVAPGFRLHLALCPLCRRYKRQLETTIATLRNLPSPQPSDEARASALAAFRNKKRV